MIFETDNVIKIKQATTTGYAEIKYDDLPCVADLSYPHSKTRRGRVQDGGSIAPTLTTCGELSVLEKYE